MIENVLGRRKGFKFITAIPEDERIVAMLVHNKQLYFATDKGIYKIKKSRVIKIIEVSGKEGMAIGV